MDQAESRVTFSILASDFHLTPADPAGLETFHAFLRDVVSGAQALYLLGDVFETWVGAKHVRWPEYRAVFDALRELARRGTAITLLHGNRDFLLGSREAAACGGRVVGEEVEVDLHGRRTLLLHGDSLCTADVGYQRSKPLLRGRLVRVLSATLPFAVQLRIAGGLRGKSKRSVAMKATDTMEIVPAEVRRRFASGYDAMVCGHVHRPGLRVYDRGDRGDRGDGSDGGPRPVELHVLGAWDDGGVFARADRDGIGLHRYRAGRIEPFPLVTRFPAPVPGADAATAW